jgi:thiamine-monophosphate kinase
VTGPLHRRDTPGAAPQTLAELGEAGVPARVAALLAASGPARPAASAAQVLVGIGDDAAVVAAPDRRVVVSTDVLVEGQHFRRDWSGGADVGARAAAQNMADIAAMGAVPTAMVVGLAAPGDLPVPWLDDLINGLMDEAATVGCALVGGDTVAGTAVTVSVTVLGDLAGRAPVLRSGARPGDVVAVCGRLGWSAAGYAVLSRGFRSPRVLVDAFRRPQPPYAAGPAAASAGASAMVDVSDGLVSEAGHLAEASGVRVDLHAAALAPDDELVGIGRGLGVDPLGWVLAGGEDHALLACFPTAATAPAGWRTIGVVRDGTGVTLDDAPFPADLVPAAGGFRHFG